MVKGGNGETLRKHQLTTILSLSYRYLLIITFLIAQSYTIISFKNLHYIKVEDQTGKALANSFHNQMIESNFCYLLYRLQKSLISATIQYYII